MVWDRCGPNAHDSKHELRPARVMETKKSRGWRYRMPKIAAVLLHFCLGYGYAERAYGQSASDEYRMKAIYLRKLPTFVEWPLQNKGKQGEWSSDDSRMRCRELFLRSVLGTGSSEGE